MSVGTLSPRRTGAGVHARGAAAQGEVAQRAAGSRTRPLAGRWWARLAHQVTTRSGLRLALGAVWLVDAILQFQPAMFGPAFAHDVLAPAAAGQPRWVAEPVLHVVRLVEAAPVLLNGVFAAVQLALGLALLLRWRPRLVLGASVAWALGVWWLGEAFGGMFGGGATLLVGAPGAALLYAVLAVLAWPPRVARGGGSAGASPGVAPRAGRAAWVGLWLIGAVLSVLPGAPSSRALAAEVASGASGGPGWLVAFDRGVAHLVRSGGSPLAAGLVALEVAIGLAVLAGPRLARLGLLAGALLAVAFWFTGQGLGAPWTGYATDVNLSPLVLLLALGVASTFWCTGSPAERHAPRELGAATWSSAQGEGAA